MTETKKTTGRVFGRPTTFEDKWPTIENLKMRVTEKGYKEKGQGEQERVFTEKEFPGDFLKCHNPLCKDGEVDIGGIVSDMVAKTEEHKEGTLHCSGQEISGTYRSTCPNSFGYEVEVKYKK